MGPLFANYRSYFLCLALVCVTRLSFLFAMDNVRVPFDFFEVRVNFLDGKPVNLEEMMQEKVVLISNIASECAFTENGYTQLSTLQSTYGDRGLVVFGAPCNQFGAQEPGSAKDIANFAENKKATFYLLEKMDVNGPGTHEMFKFLKGELRYIDDCEDIADNCTSLAKEGFCDKDESNFMLENCPKVCEFCEGEYPYGGDISWNFAYFLVNRIGDVVARWNPGTNLLSEEIIIELEKHLEELAQPMSVEDETMTSSSLDLDETDEL